MPQVPIIIPVIVAGLFVGTVLRSKNLRISKRKLMTAGLLAALLNGAHSYVVYLFTPTPTYARATLTNIPATSPLEFVAASFLAGFLLVIAVPGIAIVYCRIRKKEELEEIPEFGSEGEPTLTPTQPDPA